MVGGMPLQNTGQDPLCLHNEEGTGVELNGHLPAFGAYEGDIVNTNYCQVSCDWWWTCWPLCNLGIGLTILSSNIVFVKTRHWHVTFFFHLSRPTWFLVLRSASTLENLYVETNLYEHLWFKSRRKLKSFYITIVMFSLLSLERIVSKSTLVSGDGNLCVHYHYDLNLHFHCRRDYILGICHQILGVNMVAMGDKCQPDELTITVLVAFRWCSMCLGFRLWA